MGFSLSTSPTANGYMFGEVTSAMQKCIRRGLEEDALYWAFELENTGYGEYVWKRLKVITSEDIGLGWIEGPAVIRALYDNWVDGMKKAKAQGGDQMGTGAPMFLAHAVILLCRAKKSRMLDHACWWVRRQTERREIPDFAYDKHTAKGRQMGRSWDHFFEEGEFLTNEADVEDPYEERGQWCVQHLPIRSPGGMAGNRSQSGTRSLFEGDDDSES